MPLTIKFEIEGYGGLKFKRALTVRAELLEDQEPGTSEILAEANELAEMVMRAIEKEGDLPMLYAAEYVNAAEETG